MRYLAMVGLALVMASGCSQTTDTSVPDKELEGTTKVVFNVPGMT